MGAFYNMRHIQKLLFSFSAFFAITLIAPQTQTLAATKKIGQKQNIEFNRDWEGVELNSENTDMDDTQNALNILLSASNEPLPNNRSCGSFWVSYKELNQIPKIRDMFSVFLSVFYSGENRIYGKCEASRCLIEMGHRNDEDVFHARIRFRTHNGKVVNSSLDCFNTP